MFLKLDHLASETIGEIETILHSNERPSRGRFHERRGTNYRHRMIEMHISEIGFCCGHSASGVWVNEHAETTVPGLYAAGDMASVPHNYMLGAFVNGGIAGQTAADYCAESICPRTTRPTSRPSRRAFSRRRGARTASPPTRWSSRPGVWSTTICSRRRSPPRSTSGRSGSPRCARTWTSSWSAIRTS